MMTTRTPRPGLGRGRRGRGPLSTLVARGLAANAVREAAARAAKGRAKASLPPLQSAPLDAVEQLGAMLDLRSSVELAALLDRPIPEASALPAELAGRRATLLAELDAVLRAHDDLDLRKMPRVPRLDAKTIRAVLNETGALEAPRDPHLGRAVRSLFAPVIDAAIRARGRAEAAIDDLLNDVLPELAAASPRIAWLLRVDGILRRGTAAREEALIERALSSVEVAFTRALAEAIAALPSLSEGGSYEATGEAIEPWLVGDGVFATHLSLATAWVRACVERRVARSAGIVECAESEAQRPCR
jgi:hypothetical protein